MKAWLGDKSGGYNGVQCFCDNLDSINYNMCDGHLDGFDFDIEGFGSGSNPALEGAWDTSCSNRTPDDKLNPPTGTCYNLPDEGTIAVLYEIFRELKKRGYIVTLVPMSTAMYTSDTTAKQNQFVKYGCRKNIKQTLTTAYQAAGMNPSDASTRATNALDTTQPNIQLPDSNPKTACLFDFVDGVMLQWYSGAGLDTCGNKDCPTDTSQCNTMDLRETSRDRMKTLTKAVNSVSPGTLNQFNFKSSADDSINLNGTYDQSRPYQNSTYPPWMPAGWQKCPQKCPRKVDCPDWFYDGEDAFESQVKLLKLLADDSVLGSRFSDQLVIGLEAFPNFKGYYSTTKGQTSYTSQNWGPLPSAIACIGLDEKCKSSNTKNMSGGIAGIGIYTANTAFTPTFSTPGDSSSIKFQYGLGNSIYHKLKAWKGSASQT